MHLYHRLAVFDLQGSPFMRSRGYADTSNTMQSTLQSLEQQLAELVELTGQLAQSLMHMTGEIRGIRLESGPSSPATVSAPVSPSSASPPETGPPV
ncbi:unnamed protein product [Echinostoma caproni]|uniref:HisKA domain-containing protein n=1 Tax=Echinostoma caproni TaxID=27848 RepID=A0A183AM53_9TREM|nr:unnamed protein product [Echinostoma caproni]